MFFLCSELNYLQEREMSKNYLFDVSKTNLSPSNPRKLFTNYSRRQKSNNSFKLTKTLSSIMTKPSNTVEKSRAKLGASQTLNITKFKPGKSRTIPKEKKVGSFLSYKGRDEKTEQRKSASRKTTRSPRKKKLILKKTFIIDLKKIGLEVLVKFRRLERDRVYKYLIIRVI